MRIEKHYRDAYICAEGREPGRGKSEGGGKGGGGKKLKEYKSRDAYCFTFLFLLGSLL